MFHRTTPKAAISRYNPLRAVLRLSKAKPLSPLDPCAKKARRRAVLLAIGKVNRAGGAPGPYRKPDGIKC